MTTNDRILLDTIVADRKSAVAPEMSDSQFFEFFAAEQCLKTYELSYDELESGIVGGGSDGGIDGLYCFVNGDLVPDDDTLEASSVQRGVPVDLVVIQATTSGGFREDKVDKLLISTNDLFNLGTPMRELESKYNPEVLRVVSNFRRAYQALSPRFPSLSISYHYCTRGAVVSSGVQRRIETVKQSVAEIFSPCECNFACHGARELLELARREPPSSHQISFAEGPISLQGGFVCLVRLADYYTFITDASGALNRRLFDANVRDYQGSVAVNDAIRHTLEAPGPEDFWWLNNGITVVADDANLAGKTLTLKEPQVVNGLQTSSEVFKYYRDFPAENSDARTILLRILITASAVSRDRVIRSTNSQTAIPSASLRATDGIHRDIEDYFAARGYFYDRRKNYQKNLGRPKIRIVSIPELAQAVMALVLQQPDNARARPSSLLKTEETYARVFSASYPLEMFLACALLMKEVENFLRSVASAPFYVSRNNVKFHLAALALMVHLGGDVRPSTVTSAVVNTMTDAFLQACLNHVLDVFTEKTFVEEEEGVRIESSDQIAKSADFATALRSRANAIVSGKVRPDVGTDGASQRMQRVLEKAFQSEEAEEAEEEE